MERRTNPSASYQADLPVQASAEKWTAIVSFAQPFRGNQCHDGSMACEIRPAEIVTSRRPGRSTAIRYRRVATKIEPVATF
jgi:hypothetical protein